MHFFLCVKLSFLELFLFVDLFDFSYVLTPFVSSVSSAGWSKLIVSTSMTSGTGACSSLLDNVTSGQPVNSKSVKVKIPL